MNTVLIGLGCGLFGMVAPRLASMMARLVNKGSAKLLVFLTGVDDAAEALIIAKTGFHLPEWAHKMWDDSCKSAIGFAEASIGTKEFWNQVFFILKGQPNKISERLMALLSNIDWSKGLDQTLPPEVKALVNEAKEAVAVNQIRASVASLPATMQPTEEKIVATVKAMAPAAGKTIEAAPVVVMAGDINARIAETRQKLVDHLATLEAKK